MLISSARAKRLQCTGVSSFSTFVKPGEIMSTRNTVAELDIKNKGRFDGPFDYLSNTMLFLDGSRLNSNNCVCGGRAFG